MCQQKKTKTCPICGTQFTQFRSFQKVCGNIQCAIEYNRQKDADKARKAEKREIRKRKEKLKTRSDWLKDAQVAFNAYIRLRDESEPCISCGRYHQGQYHAGHYRAVKAHPELRFHPFNNNKQCSACNNHLSGNIAEYRINLADKIGVKNLEWLEGPHQAQKWTIEEIKEIRDYYKEQAKLLRN